MNKILIGFISLVIMIGLSGCVGKTTITEYYPLDRTDKSITVPAGGNYVFSLLKQGLIKDGWNLQIDDSSILTTKTSATEVSRRDYNTKYRLLMTMYIDMEGVGTFNLSVINNKSGQEVMTMFKPKALHREEPEIVAERILNWFRGIKNEEAEAKPIKRHTYKF